MKKDGFTLAEVLITLTIIGVIAALTIPNLYSKYQNHANYVALKKSYSILQNAYQLAVRENGDLNYKDNDPNGTTTIEFAEYIKPFLKYEKFCNNTTGCWSPTKLYYCGTGGSCGTNQSSVLGFKLADGSNLNIHTKVCATVNYWYGLSPWDSDGYTCYFYIAVDVNGDKGPNEGGKDVFSFAATSSNRIIPIGGNVDNSSRQNCSKANHSGVMCAYKALKEGKVDTYYDD